MKFSLITGTYGRTEVIRGLLNSLKRQSYHNFELIVVDQNSNSIVERICHNYDLYFKIKYVKSKVTGLSRARNIGIKYATGDIIAFPDDDCQYYEDTLLAVYKILSDRPMLDAILGKVVDIDSKDLIRKWPQKELVISKYNFYLKVTSITMFVKHRIALQMFDESLGVGISWGSCEDTDFIFRILKKGKKLIYTPEIKVYHPPSNGSANNHQKICSYGFGFGYFCRKQLSIPIIYLFMKVLFYHSICLIIGCIRFDKKDIKKYSCSTVSRIKGFFIRKRLKCSQ